MVAPLQGVVTSEGNWFWAWGRSLVLHLVLLGAALVALVGAHSLRADWRPLVEALGAVLIVIGAVRFARSHVLEATADSTGLQVRTVTGRRRTVSWFDVTRATLRPVMASPA